MVRAMARRWPLLVLLVVVLVVVLVACERSEPAPAPASAPDDKIDSIVADTLSYMNQLPGILIAFDGDCGAHAKRLLVLEPLVASIRTRSQDVDPAQLRDRLQAHKSETITRLTEQLKAKGVTHAEVEAKEAAVKSTCGADSRVKDAMDRVGLFKKKA